MSDFYTELDNPSLGLGYAAGMVFGAIAGALLYKLVSRKGRQLETKVAMEENTFRETTTSGISQVQEDLKRNTERQQKSNRRVEEAVEAMAARVDALSKKIEKMDTKADARYEASRGNNPTVASYPGDSKGFKNEIRVIPRRRRGKDMDGKES